MKKKCIIAVGLILTILITIIIIIKDKNTEYLIKDGIMLALTLDGEKITEYPTGTNYYVDITCENGNGQWLVEDWKLVIENITGNVICNIDFSSNPKTLSEVILENATYESAAGGSYRYSGKNPNNYISFNNDKYRIIAAENGSSIGLTSGVFYSKIIRENSIGNLKYSTSSSYGRYRQSSVYTLLNNNFYSSTESGMNAQSNTYCYTYTTTQRGKCDYTNIGILSTGFYGRMVITANWRVGETDSSEAYTAGTTYQNESLTKFSTKIGLLSVSDYAFAASARGVGVSEYRISENNWLYNNDEWTMISNDDNISYTMYISSRGNVSWTTNTTKNAYSVRPVMYLDPSVYVVSGDGSITNPYQIGM